MVKPETIKRREYQRKRYLANREKMLEQSREHYKATPEQQKRRRRDYYQANKDKIQAKRNARYRNDENTRVGVVLRSRLACALSGNFKGGSAVGELGCTIPELKSYLQAQFAPGMSWDNWARDGWHIDHIIPLASFDLTDPAQVAIACHFTNLQPLWAAENLSKGAQHVVD